MQKGNLTKEEQKEGRCLAIAKGLTCNGVKDWQIITLSTGREMAIRFSGSMDELVKEV